MLSVRISPMDFETTKAMASASVSRTRLVIRLRRSALCSSSCATSCTSVVNCSASVISGSS
jgi:hypothetical protein